MAAEFGALLRDLIERSKMTRAEFAAKAGVSAPFVSNLIAGDRTPPPDLIERWADLFALRGRERDHFLDLALLAHLPEALQPRWVNLLRRLERVEDRLGL
jgi:transcriptional regulator with XRE-family HTH domain